MKKIFIVMLIGLMANNAMASRARLTALGLTTDLTGLGFSYDGTTLFKDNRNIFLNPAQVTTLNNSFNFEMGSSTDMTSATRPHAEGGTVYDFKDGKLGFQLGRRSDITRKIADDAGGVLAPKDSVDIIYGVGRGGQGWGAGLHYADSKVDDATALDQKASELSLSGGLLRDKTEFYGTLGLIAKSENSVTNTNKWEGKTYIKAGVTHQLDNVARIVGTAWKNGYDSTVGGATTTTDTLLLDVRYVRMHKPKNDLMFFFGGGFTNVSGDATQGATKADISVQQIPMFIAIEGNATSWLDLRASVNQALLLGTVKQSGDENQHSPNTTTVGAGASLKFTNFTLDGTLSAAGSGTLDASNTMTNVALLYNF